jgi:hypothetical protein
MNAEVRLPPGSVRHRVFAGKGEGTQCTVCGTNIAPQQVQYDVEFEDIEAAPLLVMHLHCYQKWSKTAADNDGRRDAAAADF